MVIRAQLITTTTTFLATTIITGHIVHLYCFHVQYHNTTVSHSHRFKYNMHYLSGTTYFSSLMSRYKGQRQQDENIMIFACSVSSQQPCKQTNKKVCKLLSRTHLPTFGYLVTKTGRLHFKQISFN